MITTHGRLIPVFLALWLIVLAGSCRSQWPAGRLTLYDLADRRTVAAGRAISAVDDARLVLVGEHHTDSAHHDAQLLVIRSLHAAGISISIGLEMFPKDQQQALDRWVAGEIAEADFERIYLANWSFPWHFYREIFLYARHHEIPMIGLNVSRSITRQVAREGFASLSDEQRGELEGVACDVTPQYRDFIRRAFGAHGHGSMEFTHFCEAQLVWDTAMAINALNHLNHHPQRTLVLLAGSGHVRKMGIPAQVYTRSSLPVTVLLPYTPGIFEPGLLTVDDADFLILPRNP